MIEYREDPTSQIVEITLGAVDPATFWADLKFSLRHLNDFSRCAVVTDRRWIECFARALDPFVAGAIRHFPPEQIEDARRWLRKEVPSRLDP